MINKNDVIEGKVSADDIYKAVWEEMKRIPSESYSSRYNAMEDIARVGKLAEAWLACQKMQSILLEVAKK